MIRSSDLLPDELLAKHLGTDTSEDDETPEPAAEDESPELEAEDTSEDADSEPDAEDEDTDLDDAGGEEPEDEGEEEEDESDTGERDNPPDDDDFLPPFDRKEIEKNPELHKAYKHMRAAFTRRMQQIAEKERRLDALERLEREVQEFQARLADDTGAEEFLVQVALARPEVFEKAYERAVRLAENESERELFVREQRLRLQEREIERSRHEAAMSRIQARAREISKQIAILGRRAGLEDEDLELAERFVVEKIHENRLKTGRADVTDEEIQEAVDTARRFLARRDGKVEKRLSVRLQKEQDQRVKAKVAASKRPAPPRASRSPGVKPRKIGPPPAGVDPLDHALDTLLGLQDA